MTRTCSVLCITWIFCHCVCFSENPVTVLKEKNEKGKFLLGLEGILPYEIELDSNRISSGTFGSITKVLLGKDTILFQGGLYYQTQERKSARQGSARDENGTSTCKVQSDKHGVLVTRKAFLPHNNPNIEYEMKILFREDGVIQGDYILKYIRDKRFRYLPRYRIFVPYKLIKGKGYLLETADCNLKDGVIPFELKKDIWLVSKERARWVKFSTPYGVLELQGLKNNFLRIGVLKRAEDGMVLIDILPYASYYVEIGERGAKKELTQEITFQFIVPLNKTKKKRKKDDTDTTP